jgi:hypothetical protein
VCLCIGVADWVADVTVEVTSWGKCVMVDIETVESGKRTGVSRKECSVGHVTGWIVVSDAVLGRDLLSRCPLWARS